MQFVVIKSTSITESFAVEADTAEAAQNIAEKGLGGVLPSRVSAIQWNVQQRQPSSNAIPSNVVVGQGIAPQRIPGTSG